MKNNRYAMLTKDKKNLNGVFVTRLSGDLFYHDDLGEIAGGALCAMFYTRNGASNHYQWKEYLISVNDEDAFKKIQGNYIGYSPKVA